MFSFIQSCNCPSSDQAEQGRITEVGSIHSLPCGSCNLPGEGNACLWRNHRAAEKGCIKGVEKAPKCFRTLGKEECSGVGLIIPEPEERPHERNSL